MSNKYAYHLITAITISLFTVFLLSSCNHYEPQSDSDGAAAYYNAKYGASATVFDSSNFGSYGLFGTSYYGTKYRMSDGSMVVYNDNDGFYRDDRQAREIEDAISSFVSDAVSSIPTLEFPVVEESGFHDSNTQLEKSLWHESYDGDIASFLASEHPDISFEPHESKVDDHTGAFRYDAAYAPDEADEVSATYRKLCQSFDADISVLLIEEQLFETGRFDLFSDGVAALLHFRSDDDGNVEATREKPRFVETGTPLSVSYAGEDMELHDGDFSLENIGDGRYSVSMPPQSDPSSTLADSLYLKNDSDEPLAIREGPDRFQQACEPHGISKTYNVRNGTILFWGDVKELSPKLDVLVSHHDALVVKYTTTSKDEIGHFDISASGLVVTRQSNSSYESYASADFPLMDMREEEDGWTCAFAVPENVKQENNRLDFSVRLNGDDVTIPFSQTADFS